MVTKVSRWQLGALLLFMFAATDSNGGKGRLKARLAKEKWSNAAGALIATPSSPCVDDTFWSNVNGHPCAEYAQHPQWCIEADKFPDASGTPASTACPVACMTGCGAESADSVRKKISKLQVAMDSRPDDELITNEEWMQITAMATSTLHKVTTVADRVARLDSTVGKISLIRQKLAYMSEKVVTMGEGKAEMQATLAHIKELHGQLDSSTSGQITTISSLKQAATDVKTMSGELQKELKSELVPSHVQLPGGSSGRERGSISSIVAKEDL